ncbi:MAG: hypothetical protein IPO27_09310 [Bacteroidetes bacterium]|nr:hypothetical protein [Bacteroidota bacterium]
MKNYISYSIFFLVAFVMLISFKVATREDKFSIGTFANCGGEQSLPQLNLHDDNSFQYYYLNSFFEKELIEGSWKREKNEILLSTSVKNNEMPTKWVIDKAYNCVRGRSGLQWTRLCNIAGCK